MLYKRSTKKHNLRKLSKRSRRSRKNMRGSGHIQPETIRFTPEQRLEAQRQGDIIAAEEREAAEQDNPLPLREPMTERQRELLNIAADQINRGERTFLGLTEDELEANRQR